MNIYFNLSAIKSLAVEAAKDHGCNYNVILMNPDAEGKFSMSNGSTYEFVIDSYFDKPRPNAKLIITTDEILKSEKDEQADNSLH